MAERIPQSIAKLVVFRAYLTSDGKTLATGKTIAITIGKNGGAFGNPNAGATNATEISSGFYKFTLDTTDTATQGPLAWRGAEGTIDDAGDCYEVVNATNAGFTALPNAAADAAGGLPISDAGGLDLDNRMPAAAAITNLNTVYNTDFATNYDSTNDRWTVNVKTWNDLVTVALPLVPTTAGRTLDVSAAGNAGIDWSNVEAPTTTVDLSGTTIAITQKVDLNTIKTQVVTAADPVTFPERIADQTDVQAIVTQLGINGAGLTALASAAELAKVPKSDGVVTWNATAAAQIQSEAADAIVAAGLATQASVDDLPTNAELATALAAADDAVLTAVAAVETDTQDIQSRLPAALTADGLIKADTLRIGGTLQTAADIGSLVAKFTGLTSVADWLRRFIRGDAGTAGMATAETEINTGGTSTWVGATANIQDIAAAGGGGGSDPLLNDVPGDYAEGTAGYALGTIPAAVAAVVTGISGEISDDPIVNGGTLRLKRGDSYVTADGRQRTFTITGVAGDWSEGTGKLWLRGRTADRESVTAASLLQVSTTVTVTFDIAPTNFDGIPVGDDWEWELKITLGTTRLNTPMQGKLVIEKSIPTT